MLALIPSFLINPLTVPSCAQASVRHRPIGRDRQGISQLFHKSWARCSLADSCLPEITTIRGFLPDAQFPNPKP